MLDLQTEKEIFDRGYKYVAGVDEAGRGPLAGPVVAACVVIGADFEINSDDLKLVADSKKLSAKKREKLFSIIKEKALAVEISVVSEKVIDKINILQASLLAMRQSIAACQVKPDFILIDGNQKIPKISQEQKTIIAGDATVFSIAAASIIAKVSRDYLISEAAKKYPEYAFEKHKGYGTKLHLEMLEKYGPCPIHRQSFTPVKKLVK